VAFETARLIVFAGGERQLGATLAVATRTVGAQYRSAMHALQVSAGTSHAPCSAEDLASLRKTVFVSDTVRSIARLKNGQMVCATTLGTFDPPIPANGPEFVGPDGIGWYFDRKLLFATDGSFTFLRADDVLVVIDPLEVAAAPDSLVRLHVAIVDPASRRIRHRSAGFPQPAGDGRAVLFPPAPLFATETSLGAVECVEGTEVCVLAILDRWTLLSSQGWLIALVTVLGAALGGGLCVGVHTDQRNPVMRLRRAIRRGVLEVYSHPKYDLRPGEAFGC